jgi:hypothetical protein
VPGYVAPANDPAWTFLHWIGPDYFRLMEIPLLEGREFARSDKTDSEAVAVVSRALAGRYFEGREAVGQTIRIDGTPMRIVGVASDIKNQRLDEPPAPRLYVPALQAFQPRATLHARASIDPGALAGDLRRIIRELAPDAIVFGVGSLEHRVTAVAAPQRLGATLLAILGGLVLVIAGAGLNGLLACTVRQRMQEIGIRRALGAVNGDILKLVTGRGMVITCLGLGLGGLIALGLGRLLSSAIFGVNPLDPVSLAAALASLLAVALAASLAPVLLALRADPVEALRCE